MSNGNTNTKTRAKKEVQKKDAQPAIHLIRQLINQTLIKQPAGKEAGKKTEVRCQRSVVGNPE